MHFAGAHEGQEAAARGPLELLSCEKDSQQISLCRTTPSCSSVALRCNYAIYPDLCRAHEGQEAAAPGLLRLLSGGQDSQLALWDFDLGPEALTPVRLGSGYAGCTEMSGLDKIKHWRLDSLAIAHESSCMFILARWAQDYIMAGLLLEFIVGPDPAVCAAVATITFRSGMPCYARYSCAALAFVNRCHCAGRSPKSGGPAAAAPRQLFPAADSRCVSRIRTAALGWAGVFRAYLHDPCGLPWWDASLAAPDHLSISDVSH